MSHTRPDQLEQYAGLRAVRQGDLLPQRLQPGSRQDRQHGCLRHQQHQHELRVVRQWNVSKARPGRELCLQQHVLRYRQPREHRQWSRDAAWRRRHALCKEQLRWPAVVCHLHVHYKGVQARRNRNHQCGQQRQLRRFGRRFRRSEQRNQPGRLRELLRQRDCGQREPSPAGGLERALGRLRRGPGLRPEPSGNHRHRWRGTRQRSARRRRRRATRRWSSIGLRERDDPRVRHRESHRRWWQDPRDHARERHLGRDGRRRSTQPRPR